MREEIVIDIDEDGNVTIEGKNFTGKECTALTREIESALGVIEKRTLKTEYHQTRATVRKVDA